MEDNFCSNYIIGNKMICRLLIFTISLLASTTTPTSGTYGTTKTKPAEIVNNTNPLIYTRWRFDHHYLQIYRRFNKYERQHEKKYTFVFNQTLDNNETELVKVKYMENKQFEANFTQDDLIFEALERVYLSRLFPAYLYNYDNKKDLKKASDSKKISAKRCEREFNYIMDKLHYIQNDRFNRYNTTWSPELAVFFDSMATEEHGLLLGNFHWTGNWRQCHKRHIFHMDKQIPSNSLSFHGRYCIASIRAKSWHDRAMTRLEDLDEKHFKYDYQRYDYDRFFRIQLGICIPESCDTRILDTRRDDIHRLATFKLSEHMKQYELADLYCLPDETSELRQIEPSGRLFLAVAFLWCCCVLAATIYDYKTPEKPKQPGQPKVPLTAKEKLVTSLSLIRNFDRLIETRSCQPRPALTAEQKAAIAASGKVKSLNDRNRLEPNDLLFLNFLKVFTMPLVLYGHTCMMYKQLDKYVLDYEAMDSDLWFHFQASTPFYVDWFFVISGFLTTYLMFVTKKVETNTPIQWLYAMFHRYWRLMPIYFILFWFSKSVFMYTSYGPLWDYGTNNMTVRSVCRRESYIYPLTLTSNFHALHEECIMPAWYVACDMQFYILTPLFLIILYKSPLAGWLVTGGAIAACLSLRIYYYWTDKKSLLLELMRPRYDLYMRNNWDMYYTYVFPQYRIATYLIGVLAGHYTFMVLTGRWKSVLYKYESGADSTSNNRDAGSRFVSSGTWIRLVMMLMGIQFLLVGIFATYLISEIFPVSLEHVVKYWGTAFYTLDHTSAGSGMAMFLIALTLGQFKWLRGWMSKPIWTVISRINFVAFLIQIEILYWLIQSDNMTIELTMLGAIKIFCYLACFTFTTAPILVILLEFPLAQLERQFIAPYFASKHNHNRSQHQDSMRRQLQSGDCATRLPTSIGTGTTAEMVELTSSS